MTDQTTEGMMARPAIAGDAQTFIPCPMPDDVCADCGYRCGVWKNADTDLPMPSRPDQREGDALIGETNV